MLIQFPEVGIQQGVAPGKGNLGAHLVLPAELIEVVENPDGLVERQRRDLLLGIKPKDFDIATDATPEQVNKLFRNCRLIGRRFRLAHIHFGRLIIDVQGRQVWLDDKEVGLTTSEFAALDLLVRHAGKVLDRDEIMQALRGIDSECFNRVVDITMSRLRQKLGDDPKRPQFVKTVWGTGYTFVAQESVDETASR